MNDEEKKAIEEFKKVRWNSLAIVVKNEDGKMDISYFTEKHKKTILNLIEKQSKEIEELIQRNKNLEQIEKEHKEENGRLREENEVLRYGLRENKILRHGLEENTEEIDKLYKIINLMAEHIEKGCDFDNRIQTKQQILEYFTNKVEESEK